MNPEAVPWDMVEQLMNATDGNGKMLPEDIARAVLADILTRASGSGLLAPGSERAVCIALLEFALTTLKGGPAQ